MIVDDINRKIEYLRRKLISIGIIKGYTSEDTVKISQELDALLNLQGNEPRKSQTKFKVEKK